MKYKYCCNNCRQFLNEYIKHDDIPIKCCPFCYAELYRYKNNRSKYDWLKPLRNTHIRNFSLNKIIIIIITLIIISFILPILIVFISDVNMFTQNIQNNEEYSLISLLGILLPIVCSIGLIIYYINRVD